jgi:hypothetical protein
VEVTLLDIHSVEQKISVQREGVKTERYGKPCVTKRAWTYRQLQIPGLDWGEAEVDWKLLPFCFHTIDVPIEDQEDPIHLEFDKMTAQWQEEWEASDLYAQLTAFLGKHAGAAMRRVDQIICFGLGRPVSQSSYPRELRRSYVQHLAACTLRDLFAAKQNDAAPTIYAQDPAYQSSDTVYLAEHFGIPVIADPEGFKALNGNTFVMSVSPNVPVRQIALDMTHDSHGPAGFFCDHIGSDGLEGDGLEGDGKVHGDANYTTCNSSPGLQRYKQESHWMEHENWKETDCFGAMGLCLKKLR